MPNEPRWIAVELIIRANLAEVSATGEPHRLLSASALESAWAKPINRWSYEGEGDMLTLAVGLMADVAQNHPFQQGNKRPAFDAGMLFLHLNGFTLRNDLDSAEFADDFVRLVEHAIDEATFVDMLRPHVVAYPGG